MNDDSPLHISAIVLAAGGSARMGGPKQLIEFDGKTLLRRAAESASAANCSPVIVVVGAQAERMRSELEHLDVRIIENPDWPTGMASSLRTGLAEALAVEPALDAILVLLCDQPLITGSHLASLLALFRSAGKSAAASRYGETVGVPAIFAKEIFGEINQLEGDAGARRILERRAQEVAVLDLPAAAIDLDTPSDLSSFSANLH